MFVMTITGGPELADSLRELGDLTSDRRAITAIKDGMVRASAPMVASANANAPSDDKGDRQIVVIASKTLTTRQRRMTRRASKDHILTYVGERGGSSIGLLNEFGTAERFHRDGLGLSLKSVGRILPTPFMRPAFDSNAATVLRGMVPAISEVVKKRAAAVYKKNQRLLARKSAAAQMRAAALLRNQGIRR